MAIKAYLVAVSDYSRIGAPDLPCKNDLYLMKQSLIVGLNVLPSNIELYGESGVVECNDFQKMLCNIKNCKKEDIIIFYFSGHGGNGNIFLSDCCIDINTLVEYFKEIPQIKILIFDSCYSGCVQINNELNFEAVVEKLNSNCVVFASCRNNEKSGFKEGKPISLYTSFLSDAITCSTLIKKGKKSIEDIKNYVFFLSKKWEENHKLEQHPIFRSSLTKSLQFDVEAYIPYRVGTYYKDAEEFIICAVEPLHNVNMMRYAVKVILKHEKNQREISKITYDVLECVKNLQIFKNKKSEMYFKMNNSTAEIIYCYFGYDKSDVAFYTWAYRSIWASDKVGKIEVYNKQLKKGDVINAICVEKCKGYNFIRSLRFSTLTEEDFINKTRELYNQLVDNTQMFIRVFREGINGTLSEEKMQSLLEPVAFDINNLFLQLGDLPAFYPEIQEWFYARYSIASDAQEMASFYLGEKCRKYDENNKRHFIDCAIINFQNKISELKD